MARKSKNVKSALNLSPIAQEATELLQRLQKLSSDLNRFVPRTKKIDDGDLMTAVRNENMTEIACELGQLVRYTINDAEPAAAVA